MMNRLRAIHSLPRAQRGLSLVELMVSLTIGLFLLGAVSIIYVNTASTSRSSTQESQMNEEAALALELLQRQIRLTGFSNVNAAGNRLFPGQAVRGCNGGFTSNAGGTAFSALTCNANPAGPDAIAVRYEASLLNSQPVTAAVGGQSPGNCAHQGIAAWAVPLTEGVPTRIPPTSMALADNRYYIANDVDGTPSLFCQGRTGTGFGAATALIPNIENMQVQYAVTALPASGPIPHQINGYVEADNEVLTRVSVAPQPNPWTRVAALRICLIARSARPVPTGDNTFADIGRYIDCAGAVQTPNDRYVRRAYVTTVQLPNVRPGLPADYRLGEYPWDYLYNN